MIYGLFIIVIMIALGIYVRALRKQNRDETPNVDQEPEHGVSYTYESNNIFRQPSDPLDQEFPEEVPQPATEPTVAPDSDPKSGRKPDPRKNPDVHNTPKSGWLD